MRTMNEWFEMLPEDIRKSAIANLDDPTDLHRLFSSLDQALTNGFHWTESPEGHGFWSRVCISFDAENDDAEGAEEFLPMTEKFSGYGRRLRAWMATGTCSMCGAKSVRILGTDGSDDEYGGPSFCKECLVKIIGKFEESAK